MTAPGRGEPDCGPDWGIVATVKAPPERVLAFVAHHLAMGAARIWLCFDDPDDPALAQVAGLERVTAIACDAAWWQKIGTRPERHQNRQSRNAQRVWRKCPLAWLAHIDVDEFMLPQAPVAELLAALPPDQVMLRMEPFEAMHDPALADDIYTANRFRGALKAPHAGLRAPVLGRFAEVLPQAMLSHLVGKCLFRTGIPGLQPRLHGAFHEGWRLPSPPFEPRLKLLHFHAQDRAAWQAALPFRLSRGAYQYHPALQAFLQDADAAGVEVFYLTTQSLTPENAALLRAAGRLVEADLGLRRRVAALRPG